MNRAHPPFYVGLLRLTVAAAVVLCLALTVGCSGSQTDTTPQNAPEFTLPSTVGDQVRLADHRGKVILLDFWATWCPPCRAAIPYLAKLQEEYRDDGLVVLSMNMDQNRDDLDQFLAAQTVNYPVLLVDDTTRAAYGGVASIPQTFLIGRNGKIRQKHLGYDHKIALQLEEKIQILLKETP